MGTEFPSLYFLFKNGFQQIDFQQIDFQGTKQTLKKKTVGFLPWEIIKNRGIF